MTGGGSPTFAKYKYSRRFFQIVHDFTLCEPQLIRTGLVLWSSKRKYEFTQYIPAFVFDRPLVAGAVLQTALS